MKKMKRIKRYESLFGKLIEVEDASHLTRTKTTSNKLKVFPISDVIDDSSFYIGFGLPNVFIGLPNFKKKAKSEKLRDKVSTFLKPTYYKFDAKSVKREPSKITDTRGFVQSGLIIKIENLTRDMVKSLNRSAKSYEGSKSWTCVNANGKVLNRAGFTTGGEDFSDFYLPMNMAESILKNGMEYKGIKLEISVIRTTSDYLENFGHSVIVAQWMTLFRHAKINYKLLTKNNSIFEIVNNYITKIFDKVLPETKYNKVEDFITMFPDHIKESKLNKMDLTISKPSSLGRMARCFWGPHSFFEISLPKELIENELPETLEEYKLKESGFITSLKKNVLFSKPIVAFVRSHLLFEKETFSDTTEKELFNMLRTDTKNKPHKYNIIITSESVFVIKTNIKYKFVDWILSKHVLLSGYSDDVRYAGEFWKNKEGEILFNNNSGTYQPDVTLIFHAKKILNKLFPNVKIKSVELNLRKG